MGSLLNIILIFLMIAFIITFHEFGHFVFAKINGVKVDEFALGFGPKIISKQIGETVFSWRAIPLGGSCMMSGENDGKIEPRSFASKTVWQRIAIVLAGPVFNFILAFIFSLIIISLAGYDPCYITSVPEGSATHEAGLMEGDYVKEINNKNIKVGRDMMNYLYFNDLSSSDKDVVLVVERDGKELEIKIKPTATTKYFMGISYSASEDECQINISKGLPAEEAGIRDGDTITKINDVEIKSGIDLENYFKANPLNGTEITVTYKRNNKEHTVSFIPKWSTSYSTGFGYNIGREKASALQVVRYSLTEVRYWITSTVDSLVFMVTGKAHKEDVGGIIRVVDEMNDTVETAKNDGFKYVVLNLLYWAIMISANLGVMNLLPIPALDGGRLLFMLVELVRGKPVPQDKEAIVHFIGFILLMILLIFIMYNDIMNVFF